jgi:hypothetical protein
VQTVVVVAGTQRDPGVRVGEPIDRALGVDPEYRFPASDLVRVHEGNSPMDRRGALHDLVEPVTEQDRQELDPPPLRPPAEAQATRTAGR